MTDTCGKAEAEAWAWAWDLNRTAPVHVRIPPVLQRQTTDANANANAKRDADAESEAELRSPGCLVLPRLSLYFLTSHRLPGEPAQFPRAERGRREFILAHHHIQHTLFHSTYLLLSLVLSKSSPFERNGASTTNTPPLSAPASSLRRRRRPSDTSTFLSLLISSRFISFRCRAYFHLHFNAVRRFFGPLSYSTYTATYSNQPPSHPQN